MKKTVSLIARMTRSRRAERMISRKISRMLKIWIREKGYCRDIGMEEAAEQMGLSALQLKYYFFTCMDVPFLTWRKQMRIKEAKRMMRQNPELSIGRVSEAVGINDLRNFRRQFEECAGVSLSEWRKMLRKQKRIVKFVRLKNAL